MKLYIVSLKKFFILNGVVHTYGGFGEYVKMFLDDFEEVHLCVPLSQDVIEGGYPLEHPKLHYHFLPYYKNELGLLIKSPLIFLYLLRYLYNADVINPRIPDMTGVYGWLIGKIYRKPMFVSLQSDITLLLENKSSTNLKGFMRQGLFFWLKIYLFFEKMIMKSSISFPQGQRLVDKYSKINKKAIPWVSTALSNGDIVHRTRNSNLESKDKIVLLNVGRLTRAKNQVSLVKSLYELHERGYRNTHLKIVGKKDPIIYQNIIELAKIYKLNDFIEIAPPVNHGEELWRIFDCADIFVFSSIWEGTPKVILEAMARSLPIASTNVGGIPTVVHHGVNGLLSDKDDHLGLAKNIENLITMDEESVNELIGQGLDTAEKFTISAQKKFLSILYMNMGSSKMTKVLFIVAPAIELNGKRGVNGPERRSANIIDSWEEYDISPIYMYPKVGKLYRKFSKSKYPVIDFYVKGKLNLSSICVIYKAIKKYKVDIVHTQGPGSLDFMASIASALAGVKFIFTRPVMIDDLKISDFKKRVFNLFDEVTVNLAHKIIAVSTEGEVRLLQRYKNRKNKIVKIFNGVEVSPSTAYKPKKNKKFTITMCAQLSGNKGWYDFVELCKILDEHYSLDFTANIVGDGPLYDDISNVIDNNNLNNKVLMRGHTENVHQYLSNSDVFVMTSYREGLSVAVLEALSNSLPIVIYDFSGSDDQVEEGQNGFVVQTGDVESMAQRILEIYINNKSESMGRHSRSIYEQRFSQAMMVEGYVELYQGDRIEV